MLYDPKWEVQTETTPIEPWRQLLLDAADLMEQLGHCKGDVWDEHGRVCVVGALVRTSNPFNVYPEAFDNLEKFIGINPIEFNNDPNRPAEEVVAAMRGAANA